MLRGSVQQLRLRLSHRIARSPGASVGRLRDPLTRAGQVTTCQEELPEGRIERSAHAGDQAPAPVTQAPPGLLDSLGSLRHEAHLGGGQRLGTTLLGGVHESRVRCRLGHMAKSVASQVGSSANGVVQSVQGRPGQGLGRPRNSGGAQSPTGLSRGRRHRRPVLLHVVHGRMGGAAIQAANEVAHDR